MRIKKFTLFAVSAVLMLALFTSCGNKSKNEPENDGPAGTVKDICGNTYNYVKIGTQYWLAENMRCDKYDTKSEQAGKSIPTTGSLTYAPFCVDASDKSLWDDSSKNKCGVNLTDSQIKSLGYLYSWAAAVGIGTAEEAQAQTTPFNGNRQGICPNGWHVPTQIEWETLRIYVEKIDGDGYIGYRLKTVSGWYVQENDEMYYDEDTDSWTYSMGAKIPPCVDTYGFSVLPAGEFYKSNIIYVGEDGDFLTATPFPECPYGDIYGRHFSWCQYSDFGNDGYNGSKQCGSSVRCVKD